MARNELAEVIGGIFALMIFFVLGSAMVGVLSQLGGPESGFEGLMLILFIISTLAVVLTIITFLIKIFKEFLDW